MNHLTHLRLVAEGLFDIEDEFFDMGMDHAGDRRSCALNLMAMQDEAAVDAREGKFEIGGQVASHLMHTCYKAVAQASLEEDTQLSGPLLEKAYQLITARAVDAYVRALLKDGHHIVSTPGTGAPETYQVTHEVRGADGHWSVLDRTQIRVELPGPGLITQAWRRFPAAFTRQEIRNHD